MTASLMHTRNIAIIAHVDHGKTTLVDKMLQQGHVFRDNEVVEERVMDSNALEKERGITILAKNTCIFYQDYRINIVDTPGHADFSGEVERTLTLVDGVLLVVDAFDGPMPQTRFVLNKALRMGLRPVVVINKIDRPGARPVEVQNEVFSLFIELGATDAQMEFPVVFASAKKGIASLDAEVEGKDLIPLFDTIINYVPPPEVDENGPFLMQVTSFEYDSYVGQIALGKVVRGKVAAGETIARVVDGALVEKNKVKKILSFEGLKRVEVPAAKAGDIILIAVFEDLRIGDILSDVTDLGSLPPIEIGEPTISLEFMVNNSPFCGQEGKFVTSRNLRDRLMKEIRTNVALRVEETASPDAFKVSGRGELHIGILIETMRREGYEFQVSRPHVLYKGEGAQRQEPYEYLVVDVQEDYVGAVIEKLGPRKGEMLNMAPQKDGHVRLEYLIPARGLLGYRSEFLSDTKGTGLLNHTFHGYGDYKGEIPGRINGALISMETGETVAYALEGVQDRGVLFVGPGVKVYEGMIIGAHSRPTDLAVNPCKKKHLTNIRSSTAEDAITLVPPKVLSLEQALEFLEDDEILEVTPEALRIRKRILNEQERRRASKK
uniref:Large ribosomal subunit assembly factor BipA n=2 Tax=Bacteria TaxID=2 RepID=C6HW81_9BACT|nr:MAG: GTP-binding protein TypA [Leptospirillum ferrodiazotrophum]